MPCDSNVDDQFNLDTDVISGYKFCFGFGNGDTTWEISFITFIYNIFYF